MLEGVAAVLFDEFHERSLDADLGLALARDVQQGLREDLKLLVMSATIDGARVAALLGNPPGNARGSVAVIESQGRIFRSRRAMSVAMRGRSSHRLPTLSYGRCAPNAARYWHFCPAPPKSAAPEHCYNKRYRRTASIAATDVVALYGALGADEQARAIEPARPGRSKIVLATSIAETSITIEGVRIVVDSGLARVPRYEPDVGVTRLDTVRVSRAAADQRRGRAGRTEPGLCYRLWDEPQTAALEPFARPEILAADLSSFALDLAAWGAPADKLAFLDPPPRAALAEANALLMTLGALDDTGRITEEGRQLRRLPLPPRLARMVIDAARLGQGALAAELATLIGERGLGGDDIDMRERLAALRRDRSPRARDARHMAARWAEIATPNSSPPPQEEEQLDVGVKRTPRLRTSPPRRASTCSRSRAAARRSRTPPRRAGTQDAPARPSRATHFGRTLSDARRRGTDGRSRRRS